MFTFGEKQKMTTSYTCFEEDFRLKIFPNIDNMYKDTVWKSIFDIISGKFPVSGLKVNSMIDRKQEQGHPLTMSKCLI